MPVQQIYCTHCTYGTSALEQREGELADRVLGYSARAGSAERNELRNDYRSIERFLYYYLPSDTPPEEKQRLDAKAAPRRLFFCPSMGRLQMVGQVAYRQYDTAGRLGSYFAHVLFGERAAGSWSALDCLRLWNAPWVQEDSPDHPFKLPPLERLDEVWGGAPLAVNDDLVLRFLQPSAGVNSDTNPVITSRWLSRPVEQRIDLLTNALQGLLGLGAQRRENILLVVEPSVAALVFYGVVRLLPKSLAEGLSFSTYEPNAERLPATLAATTFYDPLTADVRNDLYRRRGLVINTFQDRMSESGPPPGDYARFMIERLLEEGWPAVDHLLESFEAAGAKRPEDLELFVPAHRAVTQVLSATPPEDDSWRKSPLAARYLAGEVQHQLATAPAGWPQLHRVMGTPNHLTVLELVASDSMPAGLQRPAQFLLRKFPPEKIVELVASPLLGREAKLTALDAFVNSQGRLPGDCQLFAAFRSANGRSFAERKATLPASDALLPDLLARLPEPVLRRVWTSIGEADRDGFLQALLAACARTPANAAPLKVLLLEIISQLEDEPFLALLDEHRPELNQICPPPEPVLAARLGRALYELPNHPKTFETRLAVLDQWRGHFAVPQLAERRLAEWGKVRSCLVSLREVGESKAAGRLDRLKQHLRPQRPPDFKPLAEALGRAMPRRTSELAELAEVADKCSVSVAQFKLRLELASRHCGYPMTIEPPPVDDSPANPTATAGGSAGEMEQLRLRRQQQERMSQMLHALEEWLLIYDDDAVGMNKVHVVQRLGQALLVSPELFVQNKRKMELYYVNGIWPIGNPISTQGGRFKLKYRKRRQPWLLMATFGAVVAGIVLLGGYLILHEGSPRVASKPPIASSNQPSHQNSTKLSNAEKPNPDVHPVNRDDESPDNSLDGHDRTEPTSAADLSNLTGGRTAPAMDIPERSSPGNDGGETSPPAKPVTPDDSTPPAKPPSESGTDGGASKPDRPPDSAAEDSGPQVVKDWCSLPIEPRRLFSRVTLKSWPGRAGPIKLALRGLEVASQRLDSPDRLVAAEDSEGLKISLESAEGSMDTLATFVASENELSFLWVDLGRRDEVIDRSRQWIRRCALRTETGAAVSYLSLVGPIKTETLGLINGTARLDLRRYRDSEFRFDERDDILLGAGEIELDNGLKLAFGSSGEISMKLPIHDLPDDFARSAAKVELTRADAGRLDFGLRLIASADNLPGGLKPLSDDDDKAYAEIKDHLQKLVGAASKTRTDKLLRAIDDHVDALAKVLDVSKPPSYAPANDKDGSKYNAYLADIQARIIDPAVTRREEFAQRTKAEMACQEDLKRLKQHALKVSAMLYRRVDAETFAPCLILGSPPQQSETANESSATPQSEADR